MNSKKKSVAILMTCFNRADTTKLCLDKLKAVVENTPFCEIDIIVTDDGSTDNTSSVVEESPLNCYLYKSEGNLFWSKGMNHSWRKANSIKDYDYYLWLNDDTHLFNHAFSSLLAQSAINNDEAIICGVVLDPHSREMSYGGRDKMKRLIPPADSKVSQVTFLNGNCVLVPKSVFNNIGELSDRFWHHGADYEYGFRALTAGVPVVVSDQYVGECNVNPMQANRSRRMGQSLVQRFKDLYSCPFVSNPNNTFFIDKTYRKLLKKPFYYPYIKYMYTLSVLLLSDSLYRKIILDKK